MLPLDGQRIDGLGYGVVRCAQFLLTLIDCPFSEDLLR